MQALLFCSLVESLQEAMQLSSSALCSPGDMPLCDSTAATFLWFLSLVLGFA